MSLLSTSQSSTLCASTCCLCCRSKPTGTLLPKFKFLSEPCDISCFYFKAAQHREGALWPGFYLCVKGGWWLWHRLVAGKVLSWDVPQPHKFQHLTCGTGLVISHHRAMLELLQEQLLRGRTEPKALQNLETPPLLLCLRFPTLLVPAGHELKSLKQRWLPRSTDCWCSHLSLECF